MNISSDRAWSNTVTGHKSVHFVDAVSVVTAVVPITVVQSCNLFIVPPSGDECHRVPIGEFPGSRLTPQLSQIIEVPGFEMMITNSIQYA